MAALAITKSKQGMAGYILDFIDGLPKSKGKSVILVVVDRLSKFSHFIPLSHPYTTSQVARVFFTNIFQLYGMP